MRPIAALTEKRLAVLPDVATIKEQGINVPIIANAAVSSTPAMPREIVEYWEELSRPVECRRRAVKKYVEENQVQDVFLKSRR